MRQIIVDDNVKLDAGNVIKSLRTDQDITLRQLAKDAGVSESGLSRWENGNRIPNIDTFIRVLKALDADIVVIRKPKLNQGG